MLVALALSAAALAEGTAPIADAGLGVLAYAGDTVVLNGTGSSDADGEPLTYTWTQVDGVTAELQKDSTAQPEFVVPSAGPYRFSLVVNDGTLDSTPDEVSFYAPDREATPDGRTGCSAAPDGAASGLGVAALFIAALARRSRR